MSNVIELRKAGLEAKSQQPIKVYCDREMVGDFVADVMAEDTVIVELKSVRRVVKAHETQLVNYLVVTGKPVGLILNFAESKIEEIKAMMVLVVAVLYAIIIV